jgi:hypothetical protein
MVQVLSKASNFAPCLFLKFNLAARFVGAMSGLILNKEGLSFTKTLAVVDVESIGVEPMTSCMP